MADDDPPKPCMLSTLIDVYHLSPDAVMYYGGTVIHIESEYYAKLLSLNIGRNEPNFSRLENRVNVYSSFDFLKGFFEGGICRFIWPSGFAKREYIDAIGGVPDCGSSHFADITYMIGLASKGEVVLVKKTVGSWGFHQTNETTNLYQGNLETIKECLTGVSKYYHLAVNFLENGCSENLVFLIETFQNHLGIAMIGIMEDQKKLALR